MRSIVIVSDLKHMAYRNIFSASSIVMLEIIYIKLKFLHMAFLIVLSIQFKITDVEIRVRPFMHCDYVFEYTLHTLSLVVYTLGVWACNYK